MIKYTLHKDNLKISENLPINIVQIFDVNNPDIQKSIDNFNVLYKWDKMFTLEEVQRRLDNDCKFFLFYLNGLLVGHAWFSNKTVSYDTDKTEKQFYFPEIFSFNIFVDKTKHQKTMFSSHNYYSYCVKKLIDDGYDVIHIEIDDWHEVSKKFFEKVGFISHP